MDSTDGRLQTPPTRNPYVLQLWGPGGLDITKSVSGRVAARILGLAFNAESIPQDVAPEQSEVEGVAEQADATAEDVPHEEPEQATADEASERYPSKYSKVKAFETASERAERVRLRREEVSRLKESGMTTAQIAEELGLSYMTVFNDVKQIASRGEN